MKDITDKEILQIVTRTVRKSVKIHHNSGKAIQNIDYKGLCIKAIRVRLRELNPGFRKLGISVSAPETSKKFEKRIAEIENLLDDKIQETIVKTLAECRSRDIAQVSAKSIVEGIIRDAGFEAYGLVAQTYRLKVSVEMPNKRWFTFYIKYAHLEEDIAKVNEGLEAARKITTLFGWDAKII